MTITSRFAARLGTVADPPPSSLLAWVAFKSTSIDRGWVQQPSHHRRRVWKYIHDLADLLQQIRAWHPVDPAGRTARGVTERPQPPLTGDDQSRSLKGSV